MPKIPLRIKRWKGEKGGGDSIPILSCFPFYQKSEGLYIHRVRNGYVHSYNGVVSHWSLEFWCGNLGSITKRKGRLMEHADSPICATCEGRAIGAGQVDSKTINGRPVIFAPRKDFQQPAIPEMPIQTS